jgi:hypothetical protein
MGFSKRLYEEIEQMTQYAINGEINELQAYIDIKELEDYVKFRKELVSKSAIRLVELEKDSKTEQFGYSIACQQKTTWKFDHIQKWVDKKNELSEIENKAKIAAQLNKNYFGNPIESFENNIANAITGEIIEIAIAQYSKPFIKLDKLKTK